MEEGARRALEILTEIGRLAGAMTPASVLLATAAEGLHEHGMTVGAGYVLFPGEGTEGTIPEVKTVGDLREEECRDALDTVMPANGAAGPGYVGRERRDGREAVWVFPLRRGDLPAGGFVVVLPEETPPDGPVAALAASVTALASVELTALHGGSGRASLEGRRKILFEAAPKIVSAGDGTELWHRVWEAIQELLPGAVAFRVYRGEDAAIRLAWASDLPPGTSLALTIRGWASQVMERMEDPGQMEALVEQFGAQTPGIRDRLRRSFSGRGNPLLLDDPERQLRSFVTDEELEVVRKSRPWDASPGQEIICPIVVDGRASLTALLYARPGEHPFTWEDAEDVWQLVLLAHEVMGRQELAALVSQHRVLAHLYLKTLLGVARAGDLDSLYAEIGEGFLRSVGANGIAVLSGREGERIEWSCGLEGGTWQRLREVVKQILRGAEAGPEPVFVACIGGEEISGDFGAALEGIEAMAVAPAHLGGMRCFALVLTWPHPRVFTMAERGLLEFLGVGVALAFSQLDLVRNVASLRNRTRRIADVVGQGLLELDSSGRVRFVNPLAVRLLGISDIEARHKALLQVVAPPLQKRLAPVLDQVLRGREVSPFTLSLGNQRLLIRIVSEDRDEWLGDGPVSTWSITEESETEQRRFRLERLFSSSSEMIVDLAPDGTVLKANPAARRFLEQIGAVRNQPDEKDPVFRAVWRVLGREDLKALREGATVHKSGELRRPAALPLTWEAEFQLFDIGGAQKILGIVHDRTERQALNRARETLRRIGDALVGLQESIGRLSGIVGRGHDLATAVMVQSAAAKGEGGGDALSAAIGAMSQSAEKLAREAPEDRRIVVDIEAKLSALREALLGVVGLAGRSAWVITDRTWRAGPLVQELERVGWSCRAVLPNDPLTQSGLPEPRIVVLDVGSLTTAVNLYGRIRNAHPAAGILLAAPLGGAAAGDLSEDPRLRIVDAVPAGQELQELLDELADAAMREP